MANNKFQLSDGTVLLDLTSDTAIAADVAQGKTFHLASGAAAVGTNTGGGGTPVDMYAGRNEPTAAIGDLWVDTSDERGDWPPAVIVSGDTPVLMSSRYAAEVESTSMTDTGLSLEIPKTGEYKIKFAAASTSSSGTFTAQLYKNGRAVSGAVVSWDDHTGSYSGAQDCEEGDVLSVYARSRGYGYPIIVFGLVACVDGDNGF